jgi:hypothetical protein
MERVYGNRDDDGTDVGILNDGRYVGSAFTRRPKKREARNIQHAS